LMLLFLPVDGGAPFGLREDTLDGWACLPELRRSRSLEHHRIVAVRYNYTYEPFLRTGSACCALFMLKMPHSTAFQPLKRLQHAQEQARTAPILRSRCMMLLNIHSSPAPVSGAGSGHPEVVSPPLRTWAGRQNMGKTGCKGMGASPIPSQCANTCMHATPCY
jgi:hypothetical protein